MDEYKIESIDESTIHDFAIVGHHSTLIERTKIDLQKWKEACSRSNLDQVRCGRCWTRKWQCYCHVLSALREEHLEKNLKLEHCEVIIYYASKEIGRTANTAHIFEELLPYCTDRLLYGDTVREQRLIGEIVREHRQGRPRTCIMYPAKDAMLLSEWTTMARRLQQSAQQPEACPDGTSTGNIANVNPEKIRLIALDGTYSWARRLYKHLELSLHTALDGTSTDLPIVPLVKLDLGEGGVRSSIAGIMQQPGEDKICTFQALVLALQQLGESTEMCAELLRNLDSWLEWILESGIKQAKTQKTINKKTPGALSESQRAHPDFILKYIEKTEKRVIELNDPEYLRKMKWKLERRSRTQGAEALTPSSTRVGESEGYANGDEESPTVMLATTVATGSEITAIETNPAVNIPSLQSLYLDNRKC